MGQFDNDRTVLSIKNRMKQLGIDLDVYIGEITNTWDKTPMGFGFTYKDKTSYQRLMTALVMNKNFGTDSMLGSSQHLGASFREVNKSDSLHVVITKGGETGSPNLLKSSASVHLDSVSPVEGVDPNTGIIIYDTGKVLQHLATDLLHTPLIMPSSDRGIVFGFRF